jgi:hypothetical protein
VDGRRPRRSVYRVIGDAMVSRSWQVLRCFNQGRDNQRGNRERVFIEVHCIRAPSESDLAGVSTVAGGFHEGQLAVLEARQSQFFKAIQPARPPLHHLDPFVPKLCSGIGAADGIASEACPVCCLILNVETPPESRSSRNRRARRCRLGKRSGCLPDRRGSRCAKTRRPCAPTCRTPARAVRSRARRPAIARVSRQTGWSDFELIGRAVDHRPGRADLGLSNGRCRLDVHDHRILQVDEVLVGMGVDGGAVGRGVATGRNAQTAAIRRRLGEPVKSTLERGRSD